MTANGARFLEHINVTVRDPAATAAWLEKVFGWKRRWEGAAIDDGYSIHIGNDAQYLALYGPAGSPSQVASDRGRMGSLNHIGLAVDDLDSVEEAIIALGFKPYSHADYEPGRRFYFRDDNGIEFEIVSYAA